MLRSTLSLFALMTVAVGAGAAILAGPGSNVVPEWLTGLDLADAGGDDGVVEGWVHSVDTTGRVVEVSRGLLPLSVRAISIGADADIRVYDKIGVIEDLRDGVRIKVCYDNRGEIRSARTVEVPPSPGRCRSAPTQALAPTAIEEPAAATATTKAVGDAHPAALGSAASTVSAPLSRAEPKPIPPKPDPTAPRPARQRPSAAPRPPAGREHDAVTARAGTSVETTEMGHDYGAVIDWVLRR